MNRPTAKRKRHDDEGHPVAPIAASYRHLGSYHSHHGESPLGVEVTRSLIPWARVRVLGARS